MVEVAEVVDINLAAVLVSAVVMFALGALWYSPMLFAKPWQKLTKISAKDMRKNMVATYTAAFLCYLIASYALAYFIAQLDATGAAEGAVVGALASFGFTVPLSLSNMLFHNTRKKLWAINTGYAVLGFLVMGAILGAWK